MFLGNPPRYNGPMKDYYKILEIQPDASLEVMNNAYRALVRKYHPDQFHTTLKGPMTAKMQEINEAYNTISNADSRAEYDRHYQASPPPFSQPASLPAFRWKALLFWAIGTFIIARLLLKPLLFNPVGRVFILGILLYILFKAFKRSKDRPL